jgi:creatinine amidohydrolase/Fe(II)-dependent formamide hydrolase-like protein
MNMYIPYMTHEEIAQAIAGGCDTAIISMGATEQHGPHSPLGTDTIATEEVAWRLGKKINALVAPTIPVGFSEQHLDWPGSITVDISTLAAILVDEVSSLAHAGIEKFVMFSWHGGNKPVLDLAAREAKLANPDIQVVVFNMLPMQTGAEMQKRVEERLGVKFRDIWGAHGGEQETSCAMIRDDASVHLDKAPPPPEGIKGYLEKTRNPHASIVSFDLKRYTPWGSWGDARTASKAQGIATVEVASDLMAEALEGRWE